MQSERESVSYGVPPAAAGIFSDRERMRFPAERTSYICNQVNQETVFKIASNSMFMDGKSLRLNYELSDIAMTTTATGTNVWAKATGAKLYHSMLWNGVADLIESIRLLTEGGIELHNMDNYNLYNSIIDNATVSDEWRDCEGALELAFRQDSGLKQFMAINGRASGNYELVALNPAANPDQDVTAAAAGLVADGTTKQRVLGAPASMLTATTDLPNPLPAYTGLRYFANDKELSRRNHIATLASVTTLTDAGGAVSMYPLLGRQQGVRFRKPQVWQKLRQVGFFNQKPLIPLPVTGALKLIIRWADPSVAFSFSQNKSSVQSYTIVNPQIVADGIRPSPAVLKKVEDAAKGQGLPLVYDRVWHSQGSFQGDTDIVINTGRNVTNARAVFAVLRKQADINDPQLCSLNAKHHQTSRAQFTIGSRRYPPQPMETHEEMYVAFNKAISALGYKSRMTLGRYRGQLDAAPLDGTAKDATNQWVAQSSGYGNGYRTYAAGGQVLQKMIGDDSIQNFVIGQSLQISDGEALSGASTQQGNHLQVHLRRDFVPTDSSSTVLNSGSAADIGAIDYFGRSGADVRIDVFVPYVAVAVFMKDQNVELRD